VRCSSILYSEINYQKNMEFALLPCNEADVLDMYSFKHFKSFLTVSTDYARLSGCRFLADALEDTIVKMPSGASSASSSEDPIRKAKAQLQPQGLEFAERLRANEPALIEELDRAFRLVMAESARNEMIATLQALSMWPPCKQDIDEGDCSYEDASAALPVIAQRLYNDDRRRHHAAEQAGGASPLRRRAMTASYLVDFAHVVGMPLPALPETQKLMLHDFSLRVEEWKRHCQLPDTRSTSTDVTVALATAVFFGPVVAAGFVVALRARQRRASRPFQIERALRA